MSSSDDGVAPSADSDAPTIGDGEDDRRNLTSTERRLDALARRLLGSAPRHSARARLLEFLVFGAKQAWACVFGALLLVAIVAARLWWPDDAPLARNDLLVIVAALLQIAMLVFKLETVRELWVVLVFHVVGTAMELFKTDVGSWSYDEGGLLRIGGVPLFTGFMYAAVGSYLTRVMRLFDLRFTQYPPLWVTVPIAALVYLNFFAHHFVWDARWVLLALVLVVFGRCMMHFRVYRNTYRMPVLVAFGLVAVFIWFAENIGTLVGAWAYPGQEHGWTLVSPHKIVSWFLLMMISVVLVTLVHRPRPPDAERPAVGASGT